MSDAKVFFSMTRKNLWYIFDELTDRNETELTFTTESSLRFINGWIDINEIEP